MKIISKKSLLIIGGILCTASFGLMFVSAADRILSTDLHNAIHHIDQVNFIPTGNVTTVTMKNNQRLVQIDTDNFILGQSGGNQNNADGAGYGSILGGKKNKITGSYNIILGGYKNHSEGTHNSILGGEGNRLTLYQSYNTIIGGQDNQITGSNSYEEGRSEDFNYNVIVGGANNKINRSRNSVVIGTNSSVEGINSVVLGSNSHIKADNSFLWTDGNFSEETLQADDVFAVNAQSGVIINTNKAHSFAKLTLGGSLVLSDSDKQSDIVCEGGQGEGIMKIEKSENDQLCLCSCDGYGWSSMSSKGRCLSTCNQSMEPPKCGTEVNLVCPYRMMYSGSCENGKVIEGTGAYFVDKNDVVHRSCQTSDGQVASCSGTISQDIEFKETCMKQIGLCVGGGKYDSNGNGCSADITCKPGYQFNEETQNCELIGTCKNKRGDYYSDDKTLFNDKLNKGFFFSNNAYDWYMPLGESAANNIKRQCVEREDFDPINDAHKCKFACAAGYDCGAYNEGDFSYSNGKSFPTCLQEKRCYGDYTYLDSSFDKYNTIISDMTRNGTVYKNPTIAIKQSDTKNAFIFLDTLEQLEAKKNSGAQGCYIVCDPGTHEAGTGHLGGGFYESIEGEGKKINARSAGYCLPNCNDMNIGSRVATYNGKSVRDKTVGRGRWHYTGYDNFQNIEANDDGSRDNSCLRSCKTGSKAIIAAIYITKNNGTLTAIDETNGGEDVSERFFNEEHSNQDLNNYISENALCWYQCGNNQYFGQGRNHSCQTIPKGYEVDTGYYIEYKGVKNYTKIKPKSCLEGSTMDYTTGECKSPTYTRESQCTEPNNTDGRGNWYYRENNECKICPIGQYHTTNGCKDCPDRNALDCVKNIGS